MAKRRKQQRTAVVAYEPKAAVPAAAAAVAYAAEEGPGWHSVYVGGGYSDWQLTQAFQLDINGHGHRFQRNWVVFACQTQIASDIGKLRMMLMENSGDVWQETTSPQYSRILRKPNGFQIWQQFIESWSYSKQRRGNTYTLMERDAAERVRALYVLDPDCVTPLIAPDGSVYYRLHADDLAGINEQVVVPASEIMHDRFNCLFHPLIGIPPLFAGALHAASGAAMLEEAFKFFRNGSRPGGLLTTPGVLTSQDMKKYKTEWETNFTGANAGRTAVLGNGLKYEAIKETAVDSEIVALLNMNAESICSIHHMPKFKVGIGAPPVASAAETLNQQYYDGCLQTLLEAIEGLLDDGLELFDVDGRMLRSQFDLRDLIRMDSAKTTDKLVKEVGGGITAPNEARAELGRGPKPGGESPMMQQQNYSLAALAKRDLKDDPFAPAKPPEPPKPPEAKPPADDTPPADDAAAKSAFKYRAIESARARRMKGTAHAN